MRALVLTAVFLAGCGGGGANAEDPATPQTVASPRASAAPAATELTSSTAPRILRREDVRRVVAAGLGAFLQRISFDVNPVMQNGRFRGLRVEALQGDPSFWRGVDLRPGDVVTKVNGLSIERPEYALKIFQSLENAKKLRVSYNRAGAAREIAFPIE